LNAVPRVLDRFNPPPPVIVAPAESRPAAGAEAPAFTSIAKLIEDTRRLIDQQLEMAKERARARPHLFETAYAAADIFQMHLARAHAAVDPPDIRLEPDMRDALPTAFDRADEFIEEGRRAVLDRRGEIEALLA